MAGETINRQDIITDEALNAPLLLSENFETLLKTIEKVQNKGKQSELAINAAKNTSELKEETEKLTKSTSELEKIQKQFATSTQRLSDEYLSNKRALQAVNDEAKARLQLGDREAKSVNAQNASLKVLQAALEKNRKAYAELNSEQARASKEGQELLSIIKNQDKSVKELNESMGKHTDNVGNYEKAMGALDHTIGGVINSLKATGEQLAALALNPWVAAAAIVIGLFVALKSAADAYYESSLEGEDALREEFIKDEARMKVVKGFWEELGETVDKVKKKFKVYEDIEIALQLGKQGYEEYKKRLELAQQAADQESANYREHIRDVVDDARTEQEVSKKLEESRDKLNLKVEERKQALKDAIKLLEDQLQGDLALARADLEAEEKRLGSLGKRLIAGKLLADYTDEEINATKMTAKELEKVRDLQKAIIDLETNMNEKRQGFHKLEFAFEEEIRKEKEDGAKHAKEQQDKAQKAEYDRLKKAEDEEIRLKKEHDARVADLDKVKESNRKAAFDKWVADAKAANEAVDEAAQKEFDDEMARIEKEKEARLELLDIIGQSVDVSQQAVKVYLDWTANLSQARTAMYQKDLKNLEDRTKKELKMAGDNDAAKAVIEAKAEQRRAEIEKRIAEEKNKQARLQRAADIVQAGVTFAHAILAALAGGPPPFNLALAAITAAVAGIQLVAISSAPIPQFAKGGLAKKGLAIVGEEGPELMKRDGKFTLSPSGPTLVDLKKDTEIIPHDQTMRMLAMSAIGEEVAISRENKENVELLAEVKTLRETVATYSDKITEAVLQSGSNLFEQGSLVYRNQKRVDGSVQRIRQKNLSA